MNMQQTQGQPPGSLASSQAYQQNGSTVAPRTWHAESGDVADRRVIVENIMQLFQRKRSGLVTSDWQQKMPDFVRRLEEQMYHDSATKEEYRDLSTLESRLQSAAQKLSVARSGGPSRSVVPSSRPVSTMILTPGSTMIPTPGLSGPPETSAGNPPFRRTSLPAAGPPASTGFRMMPSSSSSNTQINLNGHLYRNNAKSEPSLANGSPFIGSAQQSYADTNVMYASSGYLGQSPVSRDCFQLRRSAILTGESSSMQSSKMIPVPGLPPQMLQQLQSENGGQSGTTQAEGQGQPRRQGSNVPNQKRPTDGSTSKCQIASMADSFIEDDRKKQMALILLQHALRCQLPEGSCTWNNVQCGRTKILAKHVRQCRDQACSYRNCYISRQLLRHFHSCHQRDCSTCFPARQHVNNLFPTRQRVNQMRSQAQAITSGTAPSTCTDENSSPARRRRFENDEQSPATVTKRMKTETRCALAQQRTLSSGSKGKSQVSSSQSSDREAELDGKLVQLKTELSPVKVETQECHSSTMDNSLVKKEPAGSFAIAVKSEAVSTSKPGKSKVIGISLLELFTAEQIREHITSLRLWIGQSKAKAEKNQSMEHQMSDNACPLCAVERLTFEPPPLYCTSCGGRIKRNVAFHTAQLVETRHYYCIPCYNEIRSETIEIEGQAYPKARLEKRKNDEETEEAWVQCDKCNIWQHQICSLFNGRRNEGGDAEYVCAFCLMQELEIGGKPLPSNSVLGAKDLPRTLLSDHLEQRLFQKLHQERTERARVQCKGFDEVPGAEGLVIRVVSSVDKKLEVKQRFFEIFRDSDYPSEYSYKSKVVLLFQNIEGVEVCLFGLYVQEFGAECPQPNNRRLYIAYLDSVKYFRPEVKTVHGEALRTFVYHEILIGYLEYSKRRGFGSCYIWACPPLRGEDYILYCHPEIQKTPKSDKLREWYLAMLDKAVNENIVVELTNFYDYFFVSPDECKTNVTAARLPYFDGDYWPGAAEDILLQLHQEEEDKRKAQRRGPCKKGVAKRIGLQSEIASNASKDLQLMHKLGQSIFPMKEDFIMVHMHHSCRHCRLFITSGYRWVCKQCKDFQLCNRCYAADQKLDEKDRHPWNSKDSHQFLSVEVTEVPADTKDKDEIMESEFFDTRQAFLSLCQGNHYQHDTLRRAKHSSMMVLYHLHNPTAPAFVTTCNLCHHEIETGQGWRCDTCLDFDVCAACYPKESARHPHTLIRQLSVAERNAQNTEARKQRVLQLRRMLELLLHASQCCASSCSYPKCRNVKNLFRHGTTCKTRASGGCAHCKMMWNSLQLHARSCKESDCRVPRCKDLKEHLRRSQLQSESRRRAAVMEMIRQRTSDVATSTT